MSRHTRRLVLPIGLALLALAGCAGQPVADLAPTTAPAPTTTAAAATARPTAAVIVGPLTGLPVAASTARRPAVVVRVPLSDGLGLDKADVVFQEYETVTYPRAVAVFQSRDATQVGPLGAARSMDPQLLPVLRPVYATAGGGTGVTDLLSKAKVATVPASGTTSTAAVLAAAPAGAPPPPPLFSYAQRGDAFASTGLHPTRSLTITVPGGAPEHWTYSPTARRWTRAGSAGVAVANLIVQTVEYKAVTLKDPTRSAQSARVLNRGSCLAFSGGSYARCNWYKRSPVALTSYTDAVGAVLRFAPGPTWVVLAPSGAQVTAT